MHAAVTLAVPYEGSSWDQVLDHIVECDTCLRVIVSLDVPTAVCEERCRQLRELLKTEENRHNLHAV
jgi:hypothetical protein